MISQEKVIRAIDEANIELTWCFDALENFRSNRAEPSVLFEFQACLCKAFNRLDKTYRLIKGEEKTLILTKNKYSPAWFSRRMKKMDTYKKAILQALSIGRSIGDAFAWIFYSAEYALIEVHAKEQRQPLLPPKVGGIGERAFVEKMQGLGGAFIIYHGITSFLRLGDVSFFDFGTERIVGLGELKTRQVGQDSYSITLGLVGDSTTTDLSKYNGVNIKTNTGEGLAQELDKNIEAKLKSQLDSIEEALHQREKRRNDEKIKSKSVFNFDALDMSIRRCKCGILSYQMAGLGLLLVAWRPRKLPSLGKRLLRKTNGLREKFGSVASNTEDLLKTDLPDNCVFVSNIGYTENGNPIFKVGSTPLFWWPIDRKAIKDIIFENVLVLTLFNPAHLWSLLRSDGYEIIIDEHSKVVSARKRLEDKVFEIRNFHHFQDLVQFELMDERSVVEMINSIMEKAKHDSKGDDLRVNLRLNIRT